MDTPVTKTILIIEDEKSINDLLFDCLTEDGYTVIQAFDVPQGLKVLEKTSCDLITLDFNLPVIDGNGFLDLLPSPTSHIPVIALSADPKKFKPNPQIKSLFSKPFDVQNLCNTIARLLAS